MDEVEDTNGGAEGGEHIIHRWLVVVHQQMSDFEMVAVGITSASNPKKYSNSNSH